MKELFWRERFEKTATVGLIARIIGRGLGVSDDEIEGMLSGYTDIVTQNRYTPQVAGQQRRAREEAAKQRKSDESRLSKVDKLTVPDEDLAPVPKKRRRSRRK